MYFDEGGTGHFGRAVLYYFDMAVICHFGKLSIEKIFPKKWLTLPGYWCIMHLVHRDSEGGDPHHAIRSQQPDMAAGHEGL